MTFLRCLLASFVFLCALLRVDAMSGKGKSRGYKRATEKRAHGEKQAEKWFAEGLSAAGLSEEGIRDLPGSDVRKAALAELLWSRTTVSQEWLEVGAQMPVRNPHHDSTRPQYDPKRPQPPPGERPKLQ